MRRLLLPCAACALGAAIPSPAAAADAPASAQAAVDRAAERFRAKDFAGALEALRAAEPEAAARNDPALATLEFNIARCLEEMAQPAEAIAAYEAYLKLPDEAHRKERAWAAIRTLEPRAFGTLQISCSPSGVRLQVEPDPANAGPATCPLTRGRLRPGTYQIRASAAGHLPQDRQVEVHLGEPTWVELVLPPEPAAAPSTPPEAPSPAEASFGPWPFVALGLGLAAFGGGAALTFGALDARTDAEALPPGARRDDKVDAFHLREHLSWAAYGLGAAGIAWAGALFARGPSTPSASTPVTP